MQFEIELNTPDQMLFGIYFMNSTAENMLTSEIRNAKCIQIGFLFFTISIHILS